MASCRDSGSPQRVLRPQIAQPVKIMERYDIRKVTKLTAEQITAACKSTKRTVDPSAFVLDMGQNLAGFPEITVRGKKGQKITLLVSESLTDEGACNQRQTGRQHYYEYTLKGREWRLGILVFLTMAFGIFRWKALC